MKTGRYRSGGDAFTLVELMVSMVILSIMLLLCSSVLNQAGKGWQLAKSKADQFREARTAFEMITRNLSQATLDTYWDYFYAETGSNIPPSAPTAQPAGYVRQSELQFRISDTWRIFGDQYLRASYPGHAVFFQAPLGLTRNYTGLGNLLNSRAYFVAFTSDDADKPAFIRDRGIPSKLRYRLYEYRPPSEKVSEIGFSSAGDTIYANPGGWIQEGATAANALNGSMSIVADNIVLLLLSPRVSDDAAAALKRDPWWIASRYAYNSLDTDNSTFEIEPPKVDGTGKVNQGTQHLLPPLVNVTMVALDEASAEKWAASHSDRPVDIITESGAGFTDVSGYASDLQRLETYLTGEKLRYRVFTATVPMTNARWDERTF